MAEESNKINNVKGFLEGKDGGKSSGRLAGLVVTFTLLFMVVGTQIARIIQDFQKGNSIELIDVSMSVGFLLLCGFAPKLAETFANIFKNRG